MTAQTRKLPGISPVDLSDWIQIDDAYSAQLARRSKLIADHMPMVHQLMPHAIGMAREVLELVLANTPQIVVNSGVATRPDGVQVPIDFDAPLITLGHLVQEDFLIHEQQGDDHVLVGAILCFPASWTLADKFGKTTTQIHDPVDEYDADLAARVERMFAAIRPGQPLMRRNALRYSDPELFQPNRDGDPGRVGNRGAFIRSERQTLVRLPKTNAVVFSVHTYQVREENLTPEQAVGLIEHPIIFVGANS